MDEEENINTESTGLNIYHIGSLSFLPIKTLFVLEGCWSVDLTSNKIRFTAEVLINVFEMHRKNCSFISLFSYT